MLLSVFHRVKYFALVFPAGDALIEHLDFIERIIFAPSPELPHNNYARAKSIEYFWYSFLNPGISGALILAKDFSVSTTLSVLLSFSHD